MHPVLFGCCPLDHPQQDLRAEWLSPFWWMRQIVEHFQAVKEIRAAMDSLGMQPRNDPAMAGSFRAGEFHEADDQVTAPQEGPPWNRIAS
jgi:hypothetical protein